MFVACIQLNSIPALRFCVIQRRQQVHRSWVTFKHASALCLAWHSSAQQLSSQFPRGPQAVHLLFWFLCSLLSSAAGQIGARWRVGWVWLRCLFARFLWPSLYIRTYDKHKASQGPKLLAQTATQFAQPKNTELDWA
jgi:hypothetical protein